MSKGGLRWTEEQLRDYQGGRKPEPVKHVSVALLTPLLPRHIPDPVPEYRFDPGRKWRIDFAFVAEKLAVEIEGGAWTQGRHTRGKGFLSDMAKYNALAVAGWSLLRFTPQQVRSGEAAEMISYWFEMRK